MLSVQTYQKLIAIYTRGYFVYHHWKFHQYTILLDFWIIVYYSVLRHNLESICLRKRQKEVQTDMITFKAATL